MMVLSSGKRDPIRTKTLGKGAILFSQGDTGKSVYVVISGSLSVSRREPKTGKKVILAKIKERQIVGEMAFFDDRPRSATVEAIADSEVLELDTEKLEAYLKKQPVWLRIFIESLVSKIRMTNQRVST